MRRNGSYRLIGVTIGLFVSLVGCATAPQVETSLSKGELMDAMWVLPDDSIKQLASTVETELRRNPGLSEEQQNTLVFELVEAEVKLHAGEDLTTQERYPWGELSPAERRLCVSYPGNCLKSRDFSVRASAEQTKWYKTGRRRGKMDAFRHAFWSALMTFHINATWANQFATAHESDSPRDNEREMDLRNNGRGRVIGLYTLYDRNLASVVNHNVRIGQLWIVKSGNRLVPSNNPWP